MKLWFRFLAGLLLLLLSAPLGAAPVSNGDSPVAMALPSGVTWSLSVQFPKVAIGGVSNEAHQTPFVLRATDAKGKALTNVAATLPQIRNSRGRLEPDAKRPFVSPRVEWIGAPQKPVTNARGEIHGLFTSGGVQETILLLTLGGQSASVQQTWNDVEHPFGEAEDISFEERTPVIFTLGHKRGDKMLPVAGHRMELNIDAITFTTMPHKDKPVEDGDAETGDESSQWKIENPGKTGSASDKARWEFIQKFLTFGGMTEEKPGEYHGWYRVILPSDEADVPVLENRELVGVDDVFYTVGDNNADAGGDTP